MEEARALTIVSALANGVNPLTGELFAVDSPYQSPDVIRALYCAVRALEAAGSAAHARAGRGVEQRRQAVDAKRRIVSCCLRSTTVGRSRQLAQAHGRTRGGIQARLIRHGRLAPEGGRPIGGPGKWRPAAPAAARSRS